VLNITEGLKAKGSADMLKKWVPDLVGRETWGCVGSSHSNLPGSLDFSDSFERRGDDIHEYKNSKQSSGR